MKTSPSSIKYATCHPDRKHHGNGLCKSCCIKNYKLKQRYGIGQSHLALLLEEQANCCAICGINFNTPGVRACIDHCHTSKDVRGVLCNHCNLALGHLKDSIPNLRSAIRYLDKWGEV